jgi:hypothetical protein
LKARRTSCLTASDAVRNKCYRLEKPAGGLRLTRSEQSPFTTTLVRGPPSRALFDATTAGWWSSTSSYTQPLSSGTAATIGFHFEVHEIWTGTIFIDDVEIY